MRYFLSWEDLCRPERDWQKQEQRERENEVHGRSVEGGAPGVWMKG
jgi:hypothetical protein